MTKKDGRKNGWTEKKDWWTNRVIQTDGKLYTSLITLVPRHTHVLLITLIRKIYFYSRAWILDTVHIFHIKKAPNFRRLVLLPSAGRMVNGEKPALLEPLKIILMHGNKHNVDYSSEISPTRCNSMHVFIYRKFTLHSSEISPTRCNSMHLFIYRKFTLHSGEIGPTRCNSMHVFIYRKFTLHSSEVSPTRCNSMHLFIYRKFTLHSSEISPTRCNSMHVFIYRKFTLHSSEISPTNATVCTYIFIASLLYIVVK